jgi:hypothetical protein
MPKEVTKTMTLVCLCKQHATNGNLQTSWFLSNSLAYYVSDARVD